MTFIGIIAIALGFLMAVKLPFFIVLILLIALFAYCVNVGDGLEGVIYMVQSLACWVGAIIGWLYFYVNFQPSTGMTFTKAASWIFQP